MSDRQPYRSPEQKLSDCETLLERAQENEIRLATRVAELEGLLSHSTTLGEGRVVYGDERSIRFLEALLPR